MSAGGEGASGAGGQWPGSPGGFPGIPAGWDLFPQEPRGLQCLLPTTVHKALAHKRGGGVWRGSRGAEGAQSLRLQSGQPGPHDLGRQTDRLPPTHALDRQMDCPATLPRWVHSTSPRQIGGHHPCHVPWTDRWTPPPPLPDRQTPLPPTPDRDHPAPPHPMAGASACGLSVATARVSLGARGSMGDQPEGTPLPAWAGDHWLPWDAVPGTAVPANCHCTVKPKVGCPLAPGCCWAPCRGDTRICLLVSATAVW